MLNSQTFRFPTSDFFKFGEPETLVDMLKLKGLEEDDNNEIKQKKKKKRKSK